MKVVEQFFRGKEIYDTLTINQGYELYFVVL